MPRKRERKKQPTYDPARLPEFVEQVKSGKTIYQVAKEQNVPKETLRRWVVSEPSKAGSGGQTNLTPVEEQEICSALKFVAKCGLPTDRHDVRNMVQNYIKSIGRKTSFVDGSPGIEWVRGFEKRHPDLTRRKSEILTTARAKGLSPEIINSFFDMYEKVINENDLSNAPHRIFNLDETGLNTDPRKGKVYTEKGAANVYQKAATCGKTSYSVLFTAAADGTYLPPFVVYKGLNLYSSWTKGGPPGATYGCSASGWMTDINFEAWFLKVFIPKIEPLEKPVLLTYDGHNSHLTYETVKTAVDKSVIILCLPPNTSHAFQPLDVAVFGPLKTSWRNTLKDWSRESRMKSVDKAVFPLLLKHLCETLKPEHAISGFRGSGLYPLNRNAVRHRILETEQEDTGYNMLHSAILKTLAPVKSSDTNEALANSARKRKRVQAKAGEVLTDTEVVERLRKEKVSREEKSKKTELKQKNTRILNAVENEEPGPSHRGMFDTTTDSDSQSDSEEDAEGLRARMLRAKLSKTVLCLQKYVVVTYDNELYPGIIKELHENEAVISSMTRTGKYWKWPNKEDILPFKLDKILGVIDAPQSVNSRGHYKVPVLDW